MRSNICLGTSLLAFASAALVACGEGAAPSAPARVREVGVLQLEGPASLVHTQADNSSAGSGPITWDKPPMAGALTAPLVIELPDTVQVGRQVDVIVRTVLPDGCWRTDGQDVTQSGMVVEVTPHDAHSGAQVCTMMTGFGEHRLRVLFATAGVGTIRVHGRLMRRANQSTMYEAVNAERTVIVR